MKRNTVRGSYNEIKLSSLSDGTRKQVLNLVNKAKEAAKIDEHGGWDFGCQFDKKGRGSALNWDLYGFGKDYHTKRFLCVIQIRQATRRATKHFLNVRKSYFLLGRNEDDSVFAQPVESRVIHNAIKQNVNIIIAIQNWIFNCDYTKVIRQGDLAMVPMKKAQDGKVVENSYIIEESHELTAEKIIQNGSLYALNPILKHLPSVHPLIKGDGWFKIVTGKRSEYWRFASPTID
jgi:hypothetical protein